MCASKEERCKHQQPLQEIHFRQHTVPIYEKFRDKRFTRATTIIRVGTMESILSVSKANYPQKISTTSKPYEFDLLT